MMSAKKRDNATVTDIVQVLENPHHIFVLKPSNGLFVPFPGEDDGESLGELGRRLVEVLDLSQDVVECHARTEASGPP